MNHTSRRFKYADKAAVKRVAETLMLINGATVAKEVQKLLLLEAYIANEYNINAWLDIIADECNWKVFENNKTSVYSFFIKMPYQFHPSIHQFSYS